MQCDGCGNLHMIHGSRDPDGVKSCSRWPRCARCGDAQKADASDTGGSWKAIRLDHGLCDGCAIWEERAREYERGGTNWLIVDGSMYSPAQVVPFGEIDPTPGASFRGFGGRRFDYQRFDEDTPRSSYSMWHGGEVREAVRDRMPDNARWVAR